MDDTKKRDDRDVEMVNPDHDKDLDSPPMTRTHHVPTISATNNPILPILSYCGSSILMTVTNKFVLSGLGFNLNFFLLCVQVCGSISMIG